MTKEEKRKQDHQNILDQQKARHETESKTDSMDLAIKFFNGRGVAGFSDLESMAKNIYNYLTT